MVLKRIVAATVLVPFLVSCTTVSTNLPSLSKGGGEPQWNVQSYDQDPCSEAYKSQHKIGSTVAGGVAGAVVGGLLGALIDRGSGNGNNNNYYAKRMALAGMLVGMVASYGKTEDAVRRQCDLYRQTQAMNAQAAFVRLQRDSKDSGEIAVTPDQGHFKPGTATLSPAGEDYYRHMAQQYTASKQLDSYQETIRAAARSNPAAAELANYQVSPQTRAQLVQSWSNMRILLVGHTDDQGNAADQLALSEQRAHAVADLFKSEGIPEEALHYQGAGAAYPVADNNTPEGRQLNNRVEIITLNNGDDLTAYATARSTNMEYFSPVPEKGQITQAAPNASEQVPSKHKPSKIVSREPKKPSVTSEAPDSGKKPDTVKAEPDFFSGEPLTGNGPALVEKIGKIKSAGEGFSLAGLFGIRSAVANAVYSVKNCQQDNPERYAPNAIKRYKDNQALSTSERPGKYYPGAYGIAFQGTIGDHRAALSGVKVLRSGEVANVPEFKIYKNYEIKKDPNATADIRLGGRALALVGEDGMLLRQYFYSEESSQGMQCVDVLFPSRNAQKRSAALFYARNGEKAPYVKTFEFVSVQN